MNRAFFRIPIMLLNEPFCKCIFCSVIQLASLRYWRLQILPSWLLPMRVSNILLVWYPPTPLSQPLGVVQAAAATSVRTICRGLVLFEAGRGGGAGNSILRLLRDDVLVVNGLAVPSTWNDDRQSQMVYVFVNFSWIEKTWRFANQNRRNEKSWVKAICFRKFEIDGLLLPPFKTLFLLPLNAR